MVNTLPTNIAKRWPGLEADLRGTATCRQLGEMYPGISLRKLRHWRCMLRAPKDDATRDVDTIPFESLAALCRKES